MIQVSREKIKRGDETMRIREVMKEKGISKMRLSKLAGIDRMTLYRLLSKKDCRLSTLRKIAKALGVKVSDLIEDEVEEEPHPSPQRAGQ